jgi:stage II sporulation protein D
VLLGSGQGSVGFRGAKRACGESLNAKKKYAFVASGGGVSLRKPGGGTIAGCGNKGTAAASKIRIEGHGRYRGGLVAVADGGSLLVINKLPLEGYVKGVVPGEVPPSWPAQSLRTMAVAARSFGVATERPGPFDHYADTRSQVYGGRSAETKSTNKAVEATSGEVVKYNGKTALTYYFSTSGGRTENVEYGFPGGSPVPYLKSVKDPYDDASPVHKWTETYSDSEMESKLGSLFSGKLKRIEILETGKSPRIVRARVVGSGGSQTVTGDTLRARLGLRSTWARFKHR